MNLNDIVAFRLTDKGQEIIKNFNIDVQFLREKELVLPEVDGSYRMPLWRVLHVFGKFVYGFEKVNAAHPIFEGDELTVVESAATQAGATERDRFTPLARGLNSAPAVIPPASASFQLEEDLRATWTPKHLNQPEGEEQD